MMEFATAHPGPFTVMVILGVMALIGILAGAVHLSVEIALSRRLQQFMSTIEGLFDKALVHGSSVDSAVKQARADAEEALTEVRTLRTQLHLAEADLSEMKMKLERLENIPLIRAAKMS